VEIQANDRWSCGVQVLVKMKPLSLTPSDRTPEFRTVTAHGSAIRRQAYLIQRQHHFDAAYKPIIFHERTAALIDTFTSNGQTYELSG